jgi:enoyl-CoA hydratase
MNESTTQAGDIVFAHRCWLGHVTLNRPKAFNALTHDMCRRFDAQMRAWAAQDDVATVVVTGSGDRAFCAGGDVRALWDAVPDGALTRDFFWDEYRLNRRLFRYSKPYVALADGVTMGGGVGVSAPARFRVVTERTVFAMPETGIGLFPDVGGSYYLSRCPGQTGVYLALTGTRIKAADLLYAGLYTHHAPAECLPELLVALEMEAPSAVLKRFATAPGGEATLPPLRDAIDRCFAGATIEEIRTALLQEQQEGREGDWAQATLMALDRMSPTSLRVTLRQIREGAKLEFEDCLRMEFRLVRRFMRGHDFHEGVRALLVDKDNAPKWRPATLAEVTPAMVDAYFAPLTDEDELHFND